MPIKDAHIWRDYTQGLKPVRRKAAKPAVAKTAPDKKAARQAAEKAPAKAHAIAKPAMPLQTPTTLERNREKALRQGEIEIEAKLDLHGMTQSRAFDALAAFLHRHAKGGKRTLLIVTGKGRGGEGVLRANLKQWLGQLPEAASILALRPAAAQHGGAGAFYLLLRKKKP